MTDDSITTFTYETPSVVSSGIAQTSTIIDTLSVDDISGVENVNELYESSPYKKWIKRIPKTSTIPFDEYSRKDQFMHIAEIVLDDEVFSSGKKQGTKKRNTTIRCIPTNAKEFADNLLRSFLTP
jgi:hypothetical protein